MPRIERTASISWDGNLARGTGLMTAGGGTFEELPFSQAARIAVAPGKTSPEELLAAAHGACFAMSLAGELTKHGTPPERLDVRVRIVMDEVVGQGHLVVGSEVEADARVPGLDDAGFTGVVKLADAACPFSVLIKASASVTVRARLID